MAEQCREQCELDEVWFVPARRPPHKADAEISPAKARIDMLEFALAGCPELQVSPIEIERAGLSYTVDTLQTLAEEEPSRELFLLIGADSLADLPTWREPRRILELATVVAVNRGMLDRGELERQVQRLETPDANRVQIVPMPGIAISASDIRRRVEAGRSIRFLTPRPVEHYICEHRLYRQS